MLEEYEGELREGFTVAAALHWLRDGRLLIGNSPGAVWIFKRITGGKGFTMFE